jgi:hypothetical protein
MIRSFEGEGEVEVEGRFGFRASFVLFSSSMIPQLLLIGRLFVWILGRCSPRFDPGVDDDGAGTRILHWNGWEYYACIHAILVSLLRRKCRSGFACLLLVIQVD